MISKFIKTLFGRKEESIEQSQEHNSIGPKSDKEITEEKNILSFDLMTDKIFVYYESAYQHQTIVVRRATENNRLTLGEVLSQLFEEKVFSIHSMALVYRLAESGNEIKETTIKDANEIWKYDLFSCILKRKVDGHYSHGMYHESTLIINCTSRRYILTLTSLGGVDTVKYMRATLLVPDNKQTDDGMSLKTENAPMSISFILSYSEVADNPVFAKYAQAEAAVEGRQELHKNNEELKQEFIHGQFEFQGYEYIGYGKWLFEHNRYYDAFSILERAFNYFKTKKHVNKDEDLKSAYYDVCNTLGHCLSKLGREDEASYYYKQGASGVFNDNPSYLALSYARLGNPTAVSMMKTWINLVTQEVGDQKNWSKEVKQFVEDIPVVLSNYKQRTDELFTKKPSYCDKITIGALLSTLLGLNSKNIAPCMFVYDVNNNEFLGRIEDTDGIFSTVINEPKLQDKILVLSCNHVHYKTGDAEDKSILCSNAPLIISTHAIIGDNTTSVMRVDIVRCNFANDDNKREFAKKNVPLTYSVCFGTPENLSYTTDNNSLLGAIRKAISYTDEHRFFEAYQLAKWVFECTSNRMKSPDGDDYASNDELLWEIFFEASYRIGYCLMEMNKMNTSGYYLDIASNSGQYLHVQEYINFLSNSKDPQVISMINRVMDYSPKPKDERGLEEWHFHMAFLKRRKAYALIEEERYKEAEAYITEELLNDSLCKDFAQRELNYIKAQHGRR